MTVPRLVRRGRLGLLALALCFSRLGLAQATDSPASRCSWDGWLPPSVGRERVRRAAHLDAGRTADLRARALRTDKNSRLVAAEQLGAAQDGESFRTLLELTNDADPVVQDAAARSLGRVGERSAIPTLQRLAISPNSHVRQGAVWALGQLEDRSATSTLINASSDTSKHIRAEATWSLGLVGGEVANRRLTALATDPSPHVRLAAVCSLERIHRSADPRVRDALSRLSRDSVPIVREVAVWAATRLGHDPTP